MNRLSIRIAAVGLLALVILAGTVYAVTAGPAIDWWTLAAGGGPSTGGSVNLDATLGQPIAGPSSGGTVALNAGYWQEQERIATTTTISATAVTYNLAGVAVVRVSAASGAPSGNISLSVDGGAAVSLALSSVDGALPPAAEASFSLPVLDAGDHTLAAAYAAQGAYAASSASGTLHVNQAATTVGLSSSLNPADPGDAVTFTAQVTAVAPGGGVPTGTVTFKDGASDLGSGALGASGAATFTTTALASGSHTITAAYAGSANYAISASEALTQVVAAAPNPLPALTALNPASATAGAPDLVLTVSGSGFVATSEVRWNGTARPTTYVSATELTAAIAAADIAAAGSAQVTVVSPAPGGGTSNALTFTINAAATPVPTSTETATATPTATPTPTSAETSTPTPAATSTPTETPTLTLTETSTSMPTQTPTSTPTNTPTPTETPTSTSTPTQTPTPTETPTSTPLPTQTSMPTSAWPAPTATWMPAPTEPPQPTDASAGSGEGATATAIATESPDAAAVPVPSATVQTAEPPAGETPAGSGASTTATLAATATGSPADAATPTSTVIMPAGTGPQPTAARLQPIGQQQAPQRGAGPCLSPLVGIGVGLLGLLLIGLLAGWLWLRRR